MKVAIALMGWQFSLMLTRLMPNFPDIKLPTPAEIKEMKKQAYRRFREAIKRQREPVKCVAHRNI
ncbi:hypothetical protein ES703_40149 [subsurface metagenome]